MNPLLVGASVDIQFIMIDCDDDVDVDGGVVHDEDTNMDSTVINMGSGVKKRVTLNTHAVQQKQQVCLSMWV